MSSTQNIGTEATPHHLTLKGLRFNYLDWGNDGAEPLLLLHGFTGHARQWEYVAAELRDQFHVLALDQRGHGDSEHADLYGSVPMVDDLAAFVDALALEHFALLGQSMGGINALIYTATHDDRVDRLVLGDIGPEIAPAGIARIRDNVASGDTFASADDAVQAELARNALATEWSLRHRVAHNLRALPGGTFTWKWDRALRDGTAVYEQVGSEEQWALWRAITVPTLIVRGAESDILTTDIAERMLAALPDAELVTIERSGHTLTTDQPEAFVVAVRAWLTQ